MSDENPLSKEQECKLKKLLCKLMEAEEQKSQSSAAYEELRGITLKAFKSLKIKDYSFISNEATKKEKITFFRVKKTLVYYDIAKLKEVLGKKKANKILEKSYSISNYELFKKVMQDYGVPPSELKACIDIKESVDTSKLQRAFELDEIDLKEIKECYTLGVNEFISSRRTKY